MKLKKTILSVVAVFAMFPNLVIAQTGASPLLCPINQAPVVPGGPIVERAGVRYEFCCPGCDVTFKKDPESFLSAAREKGITVGVFVFDPVSQMRLDLENAKAFVDHQGIRYVFESEANRDEFAALPGLYAQTPSRQVLFCPVMKAEVSSYSAAAGFADFEGVRYYFCCPGCDEKFAADPGKYASQVKDRIRDTSGEVVSAEAGAMTLAPTCAGCAGEARLLGPDGQPLTWTLAYRYVGIDDVKSRHRWTLDYMVTPRLSIGVERAGSDDRSGPTTTLDDGVFDYLRFSDGDAAVMPRATWFATPEGQNHPSVTIGFASDRLSTERGQAFFATFGKRVPDSSLAPFVSVKTNTFDGRTVFPFGANYYLNDGWALQAIHDGDYSHVLLTKMLPSASVSLLWARTQYLGFAVTLGF